jgi:predicted dithiol-disulfide oxidoreductase (DUF899 family)
MTGIKIAQPTVASRAAWHRPQATPNYLDLTPKGRNENGPAFNLTDWVRHHDKYDD